MLQDYDRLASIIHQVVPLMQINKQIYGLDVDQWLAANRKQVDTLTQITQFVDLINRTILGCRGSHFFIKDPPRGTYYQGFVEEDAYRLAPSYERYLAIGRAGNGLELPLLYFHGSYYSASDFTCGGSAFCKGMKVLTCNGKTPDALVERLSRSGVVLDWDYDLNKFYTTGFYKYVPLAGSNSVVSFELEGTNGRPMTLQLGGGKRATWQAQAPLPHTPQVTLVNTNILYIRLKKYLGKAIKKVVIDIRNNGGGSDEVWSTLLTLEQLLDYYGTGDEMPLDERLNKHDPFFRRVLEMD